MKYSILLLTAFLTCLSGCMAKNDDTARVTGFVMDTFCTVEAHGAHAGEAADAAFAELTRLDGLFSISAAESDASRINAADGVPIAIAEDTASLIVEACAVSRETDGAFDLTIEPVVRLWGFYDDRQAVPDEQELTAALALTDYTQLSLDGLRLKTGKAQRVDFGAIAKGYAASAMAKKLAQYGVDGAWISLGGNVQTVGERPGGGAWRIGVRDPLDEEAVIGVVAASNEAVVTAGAYQRYFECDGKTYHHIIDPATGKPAANGLLSVTVITPDGARADALSTALFVMGRAKAEELWRSLGGFDMILVTDGGEVLYTGERYAPLNDVYRQVQIVE